MKDDLQIMINHQFVVSKKATKLITTELLKQNFHLRMEAKAWKEAYCAEISRKLEWRRRTLILREQVRRLKNANGVK